MKGKKVQVYHKKKKISEDQIIQQLKSRYGSIDPTTIKKFTDFPLSPPTLRGLQLSKYVVPTDIQRQTIGLALNGHDILGAAKTGSGKTLAFLIPVLETLYCSKWTKSDGAGTLIIAPTRELALQIFNEFKAVGQFHNLSAALVIGGKDWKNERRRMDQCNIIICTPGRLLHHLQETPWQSISNLKILVIDETDLCLDLTFQETLNGIMNNIPADRQTLLFSATQTKSVKELAVLSLKDPYYISVHEYAQHVTPENLKQSYVVCKLEDKMTMLWSFIKTHLRQKTIVFFASAKQVKFINDAFCRMRPGVSLLAFYDTLHQNKRMEIYESFRRKQHAVLFATDIAARGLDFPSVDWVLHMDCPESVDYYIHRSGRCARLDTGGNSLLVLLPSELDMVKKIEARKIPIESLVINQSKLFSPHKKLESLLAENSELKEKAKRAVTGYLKSVYLMEDKSVFNVEALNTGEYAKSLGLTIVPRIGLADRKEESDSPQKKSVGSKENAGVKKTKACKLEKSEKGSEDLKKEKINTKIENDSSDDEFLFVKRKNVKIEEDIPEEVVEKLVETEGKAKKAVTKVAAAKKLLRKKIVLNKKKTFDEEGKEVIDVTKSKVSKLARQYEDEEELSGINIERSKKILQEEDKFDKERFKEIMRERKREEKRKLKEQRKKKVSESEEEDEDEMGEDNSSEFDEGPDLSWLPDPDEIYGKGEKESDEEEESEAEDEKIHRPPKRKLKTINEKPKRQRKTSFNEALENDEELALRLLQN